MATINGVAQNQAANVTLTAGQGTVTLVAHKAESSKVITVTDGTYTSAGTGGTTLTVSPTAGADSAYRITAATTTPAAGASDVLTITLVDLYQNISSFSGDKNLTFSGLGNAPAGTVPTVTSKTGSAVNLGTATTITFASGQSSAGGTLVAYKAEGPVTLGATDTGGLSTTGTGGAGLSLTVSAASASTLVFSTDPSGATAGSAFGTQPVVKSWDAYGNDSSVGLGASKTVTIAIKTGTGTLQGTTSYDIGTAHGNGTITGTGLRIDQAGNFTLSATVASGLTEGDSASFVVSAAAPNAYRITDVASGAPGPGEADQLTIKLVDQFGNTVTSFTGEKTLVFTGLSVADNGTPPTVTDTTNVATGLGTNTAIHLTAGVSDVGGELLAYKAQGPVPPVTLAAIDTGGLSTTGTGGAGLSLTIANANPVATPIVFYRAPGTSYKIAITNLLANDTDANNDVITFTGVTSPSQQGVTLLTDANYVYYNGTNVSVQDRFTYTISDGHGGTATGTVIIDIREVGGIAQNVTVSGGGTVSIRFFGVPGLQYYVQRADNVNGPFNDVPGGPYTADSSDGHFDFSDTPGNGTWFYRSIYRD